MTESPRRTPAISLVLVVCSLANIPHSSASTREAHACVFTVYAVYRLYPTATRVGMRRYAYLQIKKFEIVCVESWIRCSAPSERSSTRHTTPTRHRSHSVSIQMIHHRQRPAQRCQCRHFYRTGATRRRSGGQLRSRNGALPERGAGQTGCSGLRTCG